MPSLLLAAVLGLFAVTGFAPLGFSPIVPLSLAGLYALTRRAVTVRKAAALGFSWGLGCFLGGVSWVYVSMHDVGGMAAPVAALATLLLCALLALFPALAMAAFARGRRGPGLVDAVAFAGCWTLGELVRGAVLTGFPWLAVGYAQTPPSPLAGYAPVAGVYGLSLLTALVAALLVVAVTRGGRWQRLAALAGVATVVVGGALLGTVRWTSPDGAPLKVSLLQGNIPQSLKWAPENLHLSLTTYLRLVRDHPADLVVLPETAIPLLYDEIPPDVLAELTRHAPVLMGTALRIDGGYVNAAVGLPQGTGGVAPPTQIYAKHHLVPFGEYIPPGFDWFFTLVDIPMNGFSVGAARQSPITLADRALMPNICYEDLFGEELIAGAAAAPILVNLSNTAWFGHSLAQPQHLQIARLRALETGRPMLRATNTGMTASIAPDGTVLAELPPFSEGALTVDVQGRSGLTPYLRWGNAPVCLLALCGVALPWLRTRVAKSTKGAQER